ncbi:hypothetical protein J6590_034730 [Homalodisca vitripennis]|nr:hypothetical protein J6590_034730 [Homalodisca vitripennis]
MNLQRMTLRFNLGGLKIPSESMIATGNCSLASLRKDLCKEKVCKKPRRRKLDSPYDFENYNATARRIRCEDKGGAAGLVLVVNVTTGSVMVVTLHYCWPLPTPLRYFYRTHWFIPQICYFLCTNRLTSVEPERREARVLVSPPRLAAAAPVPSCHHFTVTSN